MKRFFLICCLLLVTLMAPLSFAEINPLYQAQVPVASRGQYDWQQGIKKAMQQVFIKVAGNPDVMAANKKLNGELSNAASYVQSYRYDVGPDQNNHPQLLLIVSFDMEGINKILQQAGEKVWSNERPTVLIWLSVQTTQQNLQLITKNSNNIVMSALENASKQSGLSLMYPMLDNQDTTAISVNDVWSLNPQVILNASKRYGGNNILAGRVQQTTDGKWQAQWLLMLNGTAYHWQVQGVSPEQVVTPLVNNVMATMAKPYTAQGNTTMGTSVLTIKVNGVKGLDAYADVVKYIQQVSGVTKVAVVDIQTDNITLNVAINGTKEAFTNSLQVDRKMIPMITESPQTVPPVSGTKIVAEDDTQSPAPPQQPMAIDYTYHWGPVETVNKNQQQQSEPSSTTQTTTNNNGNSAGTQFIAPR